MARDKKIARPAKARKPRSKKSQIAVTDVVPSLCEPPAVLAAAAHEPQSPPVELPECLDSSAAEAVRNLFLSVRGRSIEVDASQVRRVGAQSLQILIAATRTWQADGQSYRLVNPSPALTDTIALLGLTGAELSIAETCR